ncbi:hypothetical protein N656DRAFT_537279 [Canariomyces notabilis]|uniref:Uncharacterized protein n=1 Tax=Canariomyces notabilis TaxID=2074819 RepID=A0AAN6THP2_9PEZI|nr:hypothetical protein N656DRAFT_537279 [Canariomyces arenarius]
MCLAIAFLETSGSFAAPCSSSSANRIYRSLVFVWGSKFPYLPGHGVQLSLPYFLDGKSKTDKTATSPIFHPPPGPEERLRQHVSGDCRGQGTPILLGDFHGCAENTDSLNSSFRFTVSARLDGWWYPRASVPRYLGCPFRSPLSRPTANWPNQDAWSQLQPWEPAQGIMNLLEGTGC